jgi:hypothetical protein
VVVLVEAVARLDNADVTVLREELTVLLLGAVVGTLVLAEEEEGSRESSAFTVELIALLVLELVLPSTVTLGADDATVVEAVVGVVEVAEVLGKKLEITLDSVDTVELVVEPVGMATGEPIGGRG